MQYVDMLLSDQQYFSCMTMAGVGNASTTFIKKQILRITVRHMRMQNLPIYITLPWCLKLT